MSQNAALVSAWTPTADFIKTTNLAQAMAQLKMSDFKTFHAWSVHHYEKYWHYVIKTLGILFREPPTGICDLSHGIETPHWLPAAKFNIADSCFIATPEKTALLFQDENATLQKISYGELNTLSNQIANSLVTQGFLPGDAIAINLPMTPQAIAIYLGILKIGAVVVSIADSFSAEEIAARLRISKAKAIFTQDIILRDNKPLPLYEKVISTQAPRVIVLTCQNKISVKLRSNDLAWENFLVNNAHFTAYAVDAESYCNILFSSGTTGDPKAIPWNHATPIKAAADAFFHHNIQKNDVLAWPTNLGWMMGPWLIFASLLNQATIAIYDDNPNKRAFGEFVEKAGVTMLGVVPTLVAHWRQSHCMEGLNWQAIKLFSSTGECSNPDDMLYLMSLANNKPIIEYCGGTEIGGAYLSSTVIEENYPSVFTTPTLGSSFLILDEAQKNADLGEVALIPPILGLSTELLNANHHDIYFANMSCTVDGIKLRRHGDQLQRLAGDHYIVLGRTDDAMNLSGIKVSAAEIERALKHVEGITETAAISAPKLGQGPNQLIIFAVANTQLDLVNLKQEMQKNINQLLNPLFKIADIILINELPKTASNKIMRRVLRQRYVAEFQKKLG